MVMINGATVLTGVVGWPVSHSRSPFIHNYWLTRYGINGVYVALPVMPERFHEAIHGLQAAGFHGLNITVPHKEAAAALAGNVDESVRIIGAANTLLFEGRETISAYNTDSKGFYYNLQNAAPAWRADSGPAVVLGAGGAARAVVHALIHADVKTIRVVNRSAERALALQAHFGRDLEICGWGDARAALEDAALLVNTTTLGMQGQPRFEISLDSLPHNAVVCDLVYAPLETELLAAARRRGLTSVDGLGMLLHQAAASFAIWFGIEPEIDDELRRYIIGTL